MPGVPTSKETGCCEGIGCSVVGGTVVVITEVVFDVLGLTVVTVVIIEVDGFTVGTVGAVGFEILGLVVTVTDVPEVVTT